MKTKNLTKTIFRVFSDGEVIALFPQLAGGCDGYTCLSYMHVGQHSVATPSLVYNRTRLAKPHERHDLHHELMGIGYNIKMAKKFTQKDYEMRKSQVKH